MTTVGIQQPTYIPPAHFFNLIARSDAFIFLDDVEYIHGGYHQRQRVKGPNGPIMLTVPVKTSGLRGQLLKDVLIDYSRDWRSKHWKTIQACYAKAPVAPEYLPLLEEAYVGMRVNHLSEFNIYLIWTLMKCLCITTKLYRAQDWRGLRPGREDHVIDLCRKVHADVLFDAGGARELLDPAPFAAAGIELRFQDYRHPEYPQLWGGPFVPYMSVIDLLMNLGPKAKDVILSGDATLAASLPG